MKNNKTTRIKSLDGLRGLSCLIVLFHHVFKLNKEIFLEFVSPEVFSVLDFVSELHVEAVMFFFVLSGFSIGLSLKDKTSFSRSELNDYFYRRLRRILPVYFLALFVAFVCGVLSESIGQGVFSLSNFLGNILFMQTLESVKESWFIPYGLNDPLWSLSYEMFFYLFFPVILYVNNKYFKTKGIFVKFTLFYVLCFCMITFNKKVVFIPHLLFLSGFLTWILGYLAARYYISAKKYHVFFSILLVFGIVIQVFKNSIPSYTVVNGSLGIIVGSVFYFYVIFTKRIKVTVVNNVFNFLFYRIGLGSYAIYALHYPILLLFISKEISLLMQSVLLIPFVVLSCVLENQSLKLKLPFLKLNYAFFKKD